MTQSIALKNGDIYLDSSGNLAFVTGLQACEQNCQTAMLALQGEMMYAADAGLPYAAVAWENYRPQLFQPAARSVIMQVQDVLGVISFTQELNGNTLSYTATISTIYGTTTFTSIGA